MVHLQEPFNKFILAYIDDLSEVPDIIDLTQLGLGGGLEGLKAATLGIPQKCCPLSTFQEPWGMRIDCRR